jgi:hypothetical protein
MASAFFGHGPGGPSDGRSGDRGEKWLMLFDAMPMQLWQLGQVTQPANELGLELKAKLRCLFFREPEDHLGEDSAINRNSGRFPGPRERGLCLSQDIVKM